jgi:hypothetical protein
MYVSIVLNALPRYLGINAYCENDIVQSGISNEPIGTANQRRLDI